MKVYLIFKYVDDYRCFEAQEHYSEVWGVFLNKEKAERECSKLKSFEVRENEYTVKYGVTEVETDKVYNVDD